MPYESPGRADQLSEELLTAWNDKIVELHEDLAPRHTRFFSIDVDSFEDPTIVTNVSWLGHPAEPTHCSGFDEPTIRALSDWGPRGRHELQNEYCEYAVVHRPDAAGTLRPKRVQITTELREYWMTLAIHDPACLRAVASEVLGREVEWRELYGADPTGLNEDERETRFALEVAGNGGDRALIRKKVPAQPIGVLNRENALFMTHQINGLDDLIYIVLFGARHFAVRTDAGGFREATIDEIFTDERAKELACRHADPRAASGAYDAVRGGFRIGFANPLGMYLRGITDALFTFEGEPLPPSWINFSRGGEGMWQRLEVGPADDDDAFLDEILLSDGAAQEPLTGGHQLLSRMDIGPLIAAVAGEPASEEEYEMIAAAPDVDCAAMDICRTVGYLKAEFDAAHAAKPSGRVRPGG